MAHWRSGSTHIPLKDTFAGPNPAWVTKITRTPFYELFLVQERDFYFKI